MTRKLAGFGLAFAMAELAAAYWPPSALSLTAVFACLAAAFWRLRTGKAPAWLPVLLGLLAGLAWAGAYHWAVIRPQESLAGGTVSCAGVIETDAEPSYMDGRLRATLRLSEVDGEAVDMRVYCAAFPGAEPGECFRADLVLMPVAQDRYRAAYYADGCYLKAEYAGSYAWLGRSDAPRFWLYQLRMDLSSVLRTWLPRRSGGIAAAILLADRTHLSDETQEAFRVAGVSHLLSVSGLHLTMLCGLFWMGRNRRSLCRPFLAMQGAAILFYMALTGFPVSIQRAGVICLLALAGYALRRPPDLLTSLGVAAVLIGLPNACAPCDLGFQLSFCGVLGVQMAAFVLKRPAKQLRVLGVPTLQNRALSALFKLLETILSASFATLATLPSLLGAGLTVSGVAVLSNLLVVWALGPALVLSLLVLGFSAVPVLAPCMRMASLLLAVWLRGVETVVIWCAGLPGARLNLPRRYTLLVLAVLAALALVFHLGRGLRWYPLAAVTCATMAIWVGTALGRDVTRIALVGTAGNACVVVTQNDMALLFFRGGSSNWNSVQEYLLESGDPCVSAVFDLRQDPKPLDFGEVPVYTLDTQDRPVTWYEAAGMGVDCYHGTDGNLVVLDVQGYHVAVSAGTWESGKPLPVDLLCPSSALPEGIDPVVALTNTAMPGWEEACEAKFLYTGDEPAAVLRPGCSIVFEGVTTLAVQ